MSRKMKDQPYESQISVKIESISDSYLIHILLVKNIIHFYILIFAHENRLCIVE